MLVKKASTDVQVIPKLFRKMSELSTGRMLSLTGLAFVGKKIFLSILKGWPRFFVFTFYGLLFFL